MTRSKSLVLSVLATVVLGCGFFAADPVAAQDATGESQRLHELDPLDSRQRAVEMGDQRRREVERGFDRTPQDPSRRGDDVEPGDPQPQDLLEHD